MPCRFHQHDASGLVPVPIPVIGSIARGTQRLNCAMRGTIPGETDSSLISGRNRAPSAAASRPLLREFGLRLPRSMAVPCALTVCPGARALSLSGIAGVFCSPPCEDVRQCVPGTRTRVPLHVCHASPPPLPLRRAFRRRQRATQATAGRTACPLLNGSLAPPGINSPMPPKQLEQYLVRLRVKIARSQTKQT